MGVHIAGWVLLADAIGAVQSFVSVFIGVYLLLIFAYVILSWFRPPGVLMPVVRFLYDVCDPYIRLFRRFIPPLGPVDVSPIVAVGALLVLRWLVNDVVLASLR